MATKKKQPDQPTVEHRLANAETNIRLYTDIYQLVKARIEALAARLDDLEARVRALEERRP